MFDTSSSKNTEPIAMKLSNIDSWSPEIRQRPNIATGLGFTQGKTRGRTACGKI